MSDPQPIDLDRIRRHLESVRFAVGIGPTMARIVHEDVPALLAEVEALFGGEWRTETGFITAGGFVSADDRITRELVAQGLPAHQRRVWYGPVEPIPAPTSPICQSCSEGHHLGCVWDETTPPDRCRCGCPPVVEVAS